MLERFGVTEETWREGGKKDRSFLESESPLFVGRAVVALAGDPAILERSGQLFSSWELGREYRFTAVSYTHLDVYKRQGWTAASRPPAAVKAVSLPPFASRGKTLVVKGLAVLGREEEKRR